MAASPAIAAPLKTADDSALICQALARRIDARIDCHVAEMGADYLADLIGNEPQQFATAEAFWMNEAVRQFLDGIFGQTRHYDAWYHAAHRIVTNNKDPRALGEQKLAEQRFRRDQLMLPIDLPYQRAPTGTGHV